MAQTAVDNQPFRRIMEHVGPTRALGLDDTTIELETALSAGVRFDARATAPGRRLKSSCSRA